MSSYKKNINEYKNYLQLEIGLTKNTVEAYIADISKFISYIEKNKISETNFLDYNKELKNIGIAATTRIRYQSSIISFLKWLIQEKNAKYDIDKYKFTIKKESTLPDVLSTNEIMHMMASFDRDTLMGIRNSLVIEALYSTGCRVSELCDLKISDIDFHEKTIKLLGKGRKARIVPLGTHLETKIEKYLNIRGEHNIKSSYLILSKSNKKIERTAIGRIIKKSLLSTSIETNVHPHTLRHSSATHMLEGGCGIRFVQQFLGHSSISTTQIYTKISQQHLHEVFKEAHPRS